jgi:UDP-galactopyranose mutase
MTNKYLNQELQESNPGALDLVCFSHLRWNFVYQRPQHLMSRTARERRVFFIEEPETTNDPAHLKMEKDASGVIVVKPMLSPGLNEEETNAAVRELLDHLFASEIKEYILWYYTPMALNFTRHLQPALTVYDCMDELSLFRGAPTRLKDLEQELISRADLIFTGGQTLYEGKRNGHDNVYLFPSSIDARHFEQARKVQADPDDQKNIPHPRLGFFGVIDERMDLDLIGELAQARPDWHFVMLGPVVKIEPESLPNFPNIHYLGMKTYDQLPRYLANWDAALLPFALNDSTRFISPTKIPEYLAGGKPVVSAPIQDVINPYGKQNLVSIAATADEFVSAIEQILKMKKEETTRWLSQVDQQLSQNSWDYTWKKMMTLIESSMASKEEEEIQLDEKPSKPREATIPSIAVDFDLKKTNGNGSNGNGNNGNGSGRVQPFDYLIVGAGFAGSVLAERLAVGSGKKVLIIDRRPHIAGNAYDYYNPDVSGEQTPQVLVVKP